MSLLHLERRVAEEADRRFQGKNVTPVVPQSQPERKGDIETVLGKITVILMVTAIIIFIGVFSFAFTKVIDVLWGIGVSA